VLIPNGAGEDEFLRDNGIDIRGRLGIGRDTFLVLHVGAHTGDKGHREALEIFGNARIRNAMFLLVGNDTGGCGDACRAEASTWNGSRRFRDAGKSVVVRPLSREETVAAFHSAALFLFPSNVECSPLVLFEAAASGTPFLATDVGNAAEIAEWTSCGVILPTDKGPEETEDADALFQRIRRFAGAVLSPPLPAGRSRARTVGSAETLERLYANPGERRAMAEAGREAWRGRFTWEKIALRYEELYRSLSRGARW
jgi:glycosyltransferase involved in cell wall biosynthesis